MTWRQFTAYFDSHIWTSNPSWSWVTCSTCGEVRTRAWMVTHENRLYPQWWLHPDGSITIEEAA